MPISSGKKAATVLTVLLAAQLPALALFVTLHPMGGPSGTPVPVATVSDAIPAFSPESVSDDVLWLARCIYSETKEAHEQELVAWVIRNRVETQYRDQRTYESTVLDPFQFSAFNPGSAQRRMFLNLSPTSQAQGWQQALRIAHDVYHSPAKVRPFSQRTRHFYSEQSMPGGREPRWARGQQPVRPTGAHVDPKRFRFYSGLASVAL